MSAPKILSTPFAIQSPDARAQALLSYVISHTKKYTVGPLDYCGVARRVKGRGEDLYVHTVHHLSLIGIF